jgi:hypothetical protein
VRYCFVKKRERERERRRCGFIFSSAKYCLKTSFINYKRTYVGIPPKIFYASTANFFVST